MAATRSSPARRRGSPGPPRRGPAPQPTTAIDLDDVAAAVAARGPGPAADRLEYPGARHSAVLVALFPGDEGAEVVLTRRARTLRNHRGEVSFPGGRMDPGETPVEAALREAYEEVALDPALVTVVGELDHLATLVSRSHIVPVVGTLADRPGAAGRGGGGGPHPHRRRSSTCSPTASTARSAGAGRRSTAPSTSSSSTTRRCGVRRPHAGAAPRHRHRGGAVIEGGAVTLRPWDRRDTAFVFDACQDPDIQRWTHGADAVPRPRRRGVRRAPRPAPARGRRRLLRHHPHRHRRAARLDLVQPHRLGVPDAPRSATGWRVDAAPRRGVAGAALTRWSAWGCRELGLVEVRAWRCSAATWRRSGWPSGRRVQRRAGRRRADDELVFVPPAAPP